MRVLQVHTAYRQRGGEEAVVAAEHALLRDGGHAVAQHLVDNPTTALDSMLPALRSVWNRQAYRDVADTARSFRPDVAHVHNTFFALSPSVVAALHDQGVPVVMTLHNYRMMCVNATLFRDGQTCLQCVGRSPWHGVQHACYRGSRPASAAVAVNIAVHRRRETWTRDVDGFIALTEAARELFFAAGLPQERLHVKPNFAVDPGPRRQPPSASKDVLYVGRLAAGKGVEVLLDAWRHADRDGLRLVVVGDGPLREELEGRAPSDVAFLGRVPHEDVTELMLDARALVFPSVWQEPFGLVLVEAIASGLPIVASSLLSTREILGPSEDALLSTPGHSSSLADQLARLQDPDLVDDLGARGRQRYVKAYSPATNLAALEDIYRGVL